MKMAERNALAELEFRIDAAHTEMIASEIPKPYCEYVDMARRIVAELAKLPRGWDAILFDMDFMMNIIWNCWIIAEKGTANA